MSLGTIYSENFRLTDLVGNSQSQIFTAKGFFAQSGFLNSAASDSFSFSTSPPAISFAKPQSSKMQEKSLRLTVSNSNLLGYSITTYQNQPLTTSAGTEIPDTYCSLAKKKICSSDKAAAWTSKDIYGFGYRVESPSALPDFKNPAYFRSFASKSKNGEPEKIISSFTRKLTESSEIVLRLNFSPLQPPGIYNNVIHFTALPGI